MLLVALTGMACGPDEDPVESSAPAPPPREARPGEVLVPTAQPPPEVQGLPVKPTADCNVERLNKQPLDAAVRVQRADTISLSGWVVDRHAQRVPTHVFVVLQPVGAPAPFYVPAPARFARDDIAAARQNPSYREAGFRAVLDPSSLPAGEYVVSLLFLGDGAAYSCDKGRRFQLE
jgi:hypothetical protein